MAIQPAYLPLEIKRGETIYEEFTIFQPDNVTPLNISGWVGECDVKTSVNSTGVLFSPVIGFVTDGSDGKWYYSVSAAVSATIPSTATKITDTDTYWYDVKFNTGSEVEYPLQGPVIVTGAVTV